MSLIEVQLFDQDEFHKAMDSFDLSAEFLQSYHSYVECHLNYLEEKKIDANARHYIYLATEPRLRKGVGFSYFSFKPETRRCDLCGLYMDEVEHRSKGLGTLLLIRAVEVADQLGAIRFVIAFTEKNASKGKLYGRFVECISRYPRIEFWVMADGPMEIFNGAKGGGDT